MGRTVLAAAAAAAMLALPHVITVPYLVHLLVMTFIYVMLALSYDLVVGHLGALSLGHAAFFGVGAYTAGILSTRFMTGFGTELAAAAALAMGFPVFRLSSRSLSVGTLGFAMIAQYVAHNWIDLTRGPMCITGIPYPSLSLPGFGQWRAVTLADQYYVALALCVVVVAVIRRVIHSRVGRSLHALRDDEALAASMGIPPLRYKMVAFALGAAIAGIAGAFWARYVTIVCPTEMSLNLTIDLLVIVFLGGVGSVRGVVIGAVLVAFLPEMLRITPSLRLVIYGALLLVLILRMPEGIDGMIRRWEQRWRARGAPPGGGGTAPAWEPRDGGQMA
ncbi:MAG: branched-chain amino acid ABC transporter permease [Limnochordales bacterium]